jgi:hypothetical protein
MKKLLSISNRIKSYAICSFMLGLTLCLIVMPNSLLQAQETTEEDVTEESGLVEPAMDLTSIQRSDNKLLLNARLTARIEGSLTKLWGLKVTFFQVTADGEVKLGEAISDKKGISTLELSDTSIKTDPDGKMEFRALYGGNKSLDPTEATLSITRARLIAETSEEDSLHKMTLTLYEGTPEGEKPVVGADLSVYVTRMFNPLKISEGTTDESGIVEMEIENGLSGDTLGNITLLGRLDESENYGILETSIIKPWGMPVSEKINKMPRSLWSHSPPIWMLITFIVLMVTVWGHYIVIIYELIKLRKDEA